MSFKLNMNHSRSVYKNLLIIQILSLAVIMKTSQDVDLFYYIGLLVSA